LLPSYIQATTTTQAEHPASSLVDGDLYNRWSAQGAGAWFSIELPEAVVLSGMRLWFEDGDERQQKFTTVCVSNGEVILQEEESVMGEAGEGEFFPFQEEMLITSVMIVGYGNTVNDWNSINEIWLCEGGQESSRKLLGNI
ncbi:unnamed protein product, partial [Ectocarpus sp. 13 AM-2016]